MVICVFLWRPSYIALYPMFQMITNVLHVFNEGHSEKLCITWIKSWKINRGIALCICQFCILLVLSILKLMLMFFSDIMLVYLLCAPSKVTFLTNFLFINLIASCFYTEQLLTVTRIFVRASIVESKKYVELKRNGHLVRIILATCFRPVVKSWIRLLLFHRLK